MGSTKTIVITGATSGIGAAVARAFLKHGERVFLIGKSHRKVALLARRTPPQKLAGTALGDLKSSADVSRLLDEILKRLTRIDMLVHVAGLHARTKLGDTSGDDFDEIFAVNVRAPYLLTQGMLPLLERARGQVIFVNSSIVKGMGEGFAAYKASRHALQGLADSLRQDLNRRGIRLSNLYPGQTATRHMHEMYRRQGKPYKPELLMQPRDVAELVVMLNRLPSRIEVTDVSFHSPTPY